MEVRCGHCGAPDDREGLEALTGGFGFTCATCGEPNILAPAARPGTGGPPRGLSPGVARGTPPTERQKTEEDQGLPADAAVTTCPKCGHRQADPDACHRCGLVFAHVASGRARFSDPLENHPEAEALRARWASVRGALDDEAGHGAFIELCAAHNALEYAGHCYRRLTPPGEEEDPRVTRYRERVIKAAIARVGRLERRATGTSNQLRNLMLLTLGALIVLALAAGYYLLTRYQTGAQGNG